MQTLYPIHLNIEGRQCLVVGGGRVALRKIEGLLNAGAEVHVVSPAVLDEIRGLPVHVQARPFRESDVRGAVLVIAATDDHAVNLRVAASANELNIPVNVVDQPALCSFFLPAIVRRGGLVISVSTSGASPALAKRMRQRLEMEFGPEYEIYVKWLDTYRSEVMARVRSPEKRHKILEDMASDEIEQILRTQGFEAARERLQQLLDDLNC